MIIKDISVDGYKNLRDVNISLDEGVNILCGRNAQGKTNLIEAVWICSGCRSFRSTRDKAFVGFEAQRASVNVDFQDKLRLQSISFSVEKNAVKERKITLNGVRLPLLSKLFGSLKCVVFTPEDLELSKGSPENRRSFLDLSISQIKPSYLAAVNRYNGILYQRNAFLKYAQTHKHDLSQLDMWDEQLASAGAYISVLRYNYSVKLDAFTKELYGSISGGRESLALAYHSTVYRDGVSLSELTDEHKKIFLDTLRSHCETDIRAGFTTCGVHRDDIITRIDGLNSREYGSQGQSRSIALILKLAQARILAEETGEAPVILLDDVMSELDSQRQSFILNSIEGMQLIITTCDAASVLKLRGGRVFSVEAGRIEQQR